MKAEEFLPYDIVYRLSWNPPCRLKGCGGNTQPIDLCHRIMRRPLHSPLLLSTNCCCTRDAVQCKCVSAFVFV